MNSNASTGSNLGSLNSIKKKTVGGGSPQRDSGFRVGRGLNHEKENIKISVTKTGGSPSRYDQKKVPSKSPQRESPKISPKNKAMYDNYTGSYFMAGNKGSTTTKSPRSPRGNDAIERNIQRVSGYQGQIKDPIKYAEDHTSKSQSTHKNEPQAKKQAKGNDWADDINNICKGFDDQFLDKSGDSSDEDEEEYERQLAELQKSLGYGETIFTKELLAFDPLEQEALAMKMGDMATVVSVNHDTVSTKAVNMQKDKHQKALYDQIKKEVVFLGLKFFRWPVEIWMQLLKKI